jgi:hypothetical protein
MLTAVKCTIFLFAFATPCLAQDGLTIDNKHTEKVSVAAVEKIYASACAIVQREFDPRHSLHPQVRLVLGADKNVVLWDVREIRLTRWDPYLFAQGVVMLAFADLMTLDRRIAMTKRAVTWADSAVEIERLAK